MSNTDGEDTKSKRTIDVSSQPKYYKLAKERDSLREQLKQKEDENRELREILQILQPWISGVGWIHHNGDFFDMTDRIKKAKNLSA